MQHLGIMELILVMIVGMSTLAVMAAPIVFAAYLWRRQLDRQKAGSRPQAPQEPGGSAGRMSPR
jgi:hypothetical protein